MNKITNNELIIFAEQMAMILKSGLSSTEGVSIMKENLPDDAKNLKEVLVQVQEELEMTGILYDSMKETECFPEYFINMVQVGEQTGNLDVVMDKLADYYDREEAMLQDIRSAVTYPMMMLGMMLVILLVMIIKVMPVFNQVYEQLGSQITGPAAILFHMGTALSAHYPVAIGVVAVLAVLAVWLFKSEQGKKVFRKAAGSFFATRRIMDMMSRSKFASAISMTLESGLDYEESFRLAGHLVEDDKEMNAKMQVCKELLEEGSTLADAATESGIMTGLYGQMLNIAERTGQSDVAMGKIAVQCDEEVTVRIQNFVSVLEPTLVAVLSVLVGVILLSVMVPLMGILSTIG